MFQSLYFRYCYCWASILNNILTANFFFQFNDDKLDPIQELEMCCLFLVHNQLTGFKAALTTLRLRN